MSLNLACITCNLISCSPRSKRHVSEFGVAKKTKSIHSSTSCSLMSFQNFGRACAITQPALLCSLGVPLSPPVLHKKRRLFAENQCVIGSYRLRGGPCPPLSTVCRGRRCATLVRVARQACSAATPCADRLLQKGSGTCWGRDCLTRCIPWAETGAGEGR